jgi:Flp pilus assembly pilin Flp
MEMKRFRCELGQGMTEYIVLVALVAIAAIASSAHSDVGKFVKKAEKEKNQRGMGDFTTSTY